MKSRHELDAALDELAQRLPHLVAKDRTRADFWPEFAGEADEIVDSAGPADYAYVQDRLDAMLAAHGKGAR